MLSAARSELSQGLAATAACKPLVATKPRSSGGASGLTMGMVYSTAMKSRRPHPKSAGAGCRRSTAAAPAADHHSGRAHPSAAPISFVVPAPPPGVGWTLRCRVVAAAAGSRATVRLGGGMYAGRGAECRPNRVGGRCWARAVRVAEKRAGFGVFWRFFL